MQHKFLKTNTYYSFIYNLSYLLVFTTFVDILCLFIYLSLLDNLRNISLKFHIENYFLLLAYLILDVGPKFDTSYFDVTIQKVEEIQYFIRIFYFFGKGLPRIFEIEA